MFTYRWLTTLFTREFNIADVVHIWDNLFADTNQDEFLIYFCFAMITCDRDILLNNDFSHNLYHLQNYSQTLGMRFAANHGNISGNNDNNGSSGDGGSNNDMTSCNNSHDLSVTHRPDSDGKHLQYIIQKAFDTRTEDHMQKQQTEGSEQSDDDDYDNILLLPTWANIFNISSSSSGSGDKDECVSSSEEDGFMSRGGYIIGHDDFLMSTFYYGNDDNHKHNIIQHDANNSSDSVSVNRSDSEHNSDTPTDPDAAAIADKQIDPGIDLPPLLKNIPDLRPLVSDFISFTSAQISSFLE